jgi:hypothetical protein
MAFFFPFEMRNLLLGLLGALRLELGVVVVTGVGARHVVAVPVPS